jgi:CRP-like cAMP-binding protein
VPRKVASGRPINRLLAALSAAELRRIQPHLKLIPLKYRDCLHRHRDPVEHVFFPNAGVVSLITVMEDGAMVETGTVGFEGMVGIEAFLGAERATAETVVQVTEGGDTAYVMPIAAFRREVQRGERLAQLVARYSQAVLSEVMQSVACNTLHAVQERCCRWLLRAHDRVEGDTFRLSHEYLAIMLGTRRPTVTIAAGILQKAGFIRYSKGRMTIVDRAGLESASCECYAMTRALFEEAGFSPDRDV